MSSVEREVLDHRLVLADLPPGETGYVPRWFISRIGDHYYIPRDCLYSLKARGSMDLAVRRHDQAIEVMDRFKFKDASMDHPRSIPQSFPVRFLIPIQMPTLWEIVRSWIFR